MDKKLFVLTGIALVLLSVVILIDGIFNNDVVYKATEKTIYICENDTLWSIAKEYKRENQDIRDYIYEIKKLNNMDNSTIYEGQELVVIVYEEVK